MPSLDRSITIKSSPAAISGVISAAATVNEQFIVIRPNMLFIVLREEQGFVYLLRSMGDHVTQLRLIVSSAYSVREAFRGKQPREAIEALLSASVSSPISLSDTDVTTYLDAVQRTVEENTHGLTSAAPTAQASEIPVFSKENSRNTTSASGDSTELNRILAKKPLPDANAPSLLPNGTPTNPDRYGAFMFVFMPLAGIMIGLNWRKLGKPQWMWPTIGLSIVVPAGVIAAIIGVASVAFKAGANKNLAVPMGIFLMLLAGLNYGFFYGLLFFQRGGYKKWERTGNVQAMLNHEYSFTNATLIGLSIALVFTMIGGFSIYSSSQPNVFEASDFKISYDKRWVTLDKRSLPDCSQPKIDCVLLVSDGGRNSSWIVILKLLTEPMHPAEAEEISWNNIANAYPSATREQSGTTKVAGKYAYERYMYFPNANSSEGLAYERQIFFLKDNSLYEIIAGSLTYGIYKEDETAIQAFIDAISFQ